MGLDGVEILMEVEETFNISIAEHQSPKIRTVGDLYALVLNQTRNLEHDSEACLSATTFYELRRHLREYLEDASSLRPDWIVNETFPKRLRRLKWQSLAEQMDLRFPNLERPRWIVSITTLVVLVITCLTFWFLLTTVGLSAAILLTTIVLPLAVAVAVKITIPCQQLPGDAFQTYGGLVDQLIAMNYGKLSERKQIWNPTDIWRILQTIISEQLGVKKEQVTPEANFAHDLGCD